MNALPIPFVPCFMQVTKAVPALLPQDAGAIPANPIWGPPMGAAEYDHNNPQPITIDIHIWSWLDSVVKVQDKTSGMPIEFLTVQSIPGATIVEPPANSKTPIDTKVVIPQRSLDAVYKMYKMSQPDFVSAMTTVFVGAYNKGTLLSWNWVAIVIK